MRMFVSKIDGNWEWCVYMPGWRFAGDARNLKDGFRRAWECASKVFASHDWVGGNA